ncbi:MAG: hypothetical protein WC280_00185 [Patescibacteria group bacterium]
MRTKKTLVKMALLELFLVGLPVIGMVILTLSIVIGERSFESLGMLGLTIFSFPIFISQFLLPSKIIDKILKKEIEIPRIRKIVLYMTIFPLSNLFLLLILDMTIGVIPNNDPGIITSKVLIISLLLYMLMVGSGIIYAKTKEAKV